MVFFLISDYQGRFSVHTHTNLPPLIMAPTDSELRSVIWFQIYCNWHPLEFLCRAQSGGNMVFLYFISIRFKLYVTTIDKISILRFTENLCNIRKNFFWLGAFKWNGNRSTHCFVLLNQFLCIYCSSRVYIIMWLVFTQGLTFSSYTGL